MQVFETNTPEETQKLGQKLAVGLSRGDCLALNGELGAGKTVLVRGLTEGLGGDLQLVSSPTYVLVQEYPLEDPGTSCLFHVDLFRLDSPDAEFADLGIEEMLSRGIVVIEWADRASDALPRPRGEISIEATGPMSRRFIYRTVN